MQYWCTRLKKINYLFGFLIALLLIFIHIGVEMLPKIQYLDGISLINLPSTTWIGADYNGLYATLFYLLLPLYSALGANLVVFEDKEKGYFLRYIQKKSTLNYSISAFSISFISGFLISFIPLGINIIVAMGLFPNIQPDNILNSNLGVNASTTYFSSLFFSNNYLLIFIYMIMSGFMSALFSCISATVSLYTKNIYSAISSGFLTVLLLTILSYLFPSIIYSPVFILIELSPVYKLPAFSIVIFSYCILLFLCFYTFIRGVKKNAII